MPNLKLLIAMFVFCFLVSCEQENKNLSIVLSIPEPSGLAYDTLRNKLWSVSDETSRIYLLNINGEIIKSFEIPDEDLEGITLVNDSTLAVLSEEKRNVVFVSTSGDIIDRKHVYDNGIFNNGPEGIAYDTNNKIYWVANEKNPAMIIKYDSLFNEIERKEIDFVSDVSGLCYDYMDNSLWMISDEDKKLLKMDTEFKIIESYDINIIQLEGIAIDHQNKLIYLVSDNEEKLYELKLK